MSSGAGKVEVLAAMLMDTDLAPDAFVWAADLDVADLAVMEASYLESDGGVTPATGFSVLDIPDDDSSATAALREDKDSLVLYAHSNVPLNITHDLPLVHSSYTSIYTKQPHGMGKIQLIPILSKLGDKTAEMCDHFYICYNLDHTTPVTRNNVVIGLAQAVMPYCNRLPLFLSNGSSISLQLQFTRFGSIAGVKGYTPRAGGVPVNALTKLGEATAGPLSRYAAGFVGSVLVAAPLSAGLKDAPKDVFMPIHKSNHLFLLYDSAAVASAGGISSCPHAYNPPIGGLLSGAVLFNPNLLRGELCTDPQCTLLKISEKSDHRKRNHSGDRVQPARAPSSRVQHCSDQKAYTAFLSGNGIPLVERFKANAYCLAFGAANVTAITRSTAEGGWSLKEQSIHAYYGPMNKGDEGSLKNYKTTQGKLKDYSMRLRRHHDAFTSGAGNGEVLPGLSADFAAAALDARLDAVAAADLR